MDADLGIMSHHDIEYEKNWRMIRNIFILKFLIISQMISNTKEMMVNMQSKEEHPTLDLEQSFEESETDREIYTEENTAPEIF